MHNIEIDDTMMTININDDDNDCEEDDDDDEQIKIIQQQQQQQSNPDRNNNEKNKCFNIWPSLFRRSTYLKRYKRGHSHSLEKHRSRYYSQSFGSSLNDDNLSLSSSKPISSNVPFPITDKYLTHGSPISPRVKNFNLDMKILVLSRNDNPYLSKQLERSNSLTSNNSSTVTDEQEYFAIDTPHSALHTPIFNRRNYRINNGRSSSSTGQHQHQQQQQQHRSTLSFTFGYDNHRDLEDGKNLHEQLIRSPPPNFPEKLSEFLFTENLIKNLNNQ
ncbi:hypothetical protein DERF_006037 [Dermatophagoides farinae]|uniref:Uncharacterized protein n=1 Tax=Dermatophagoides farinae TaxID=6954 RepID=A0A922I6T2_DERFA|nr:hypothetical protein DERF_006037 [Dermatophagoides farinae]